MNAQRAQDIAFSSDMANVTYNGESVYIEHVDETNGTATIHPLHSPENKQSVPVDSLQEQ
ncbi:small acid-soluble spore protein H [Thalassobacillus devorans]|uniref:small acid-soluble spore protein H n=1 Tax=Thalassobacillus devorans TaxID=279813 RepID=UPI000A02813F|nr:small acid-soluble spore protein H [Thalassobacillus devorans]